MAAPAAASTWSLERGASVVGDGVVRFCVWAPRAKRVAVRARGRGREAWDLERGEHGVWEGDVRGIAPGDDYVYVIDGERARPDPVSRFQPDGVHGASRIVDPSAFAWRDDAWRGLEMADYVIYELHVGTFTREGTFDAAIAHLGELAALGVTAIEIMPVAQFPGARNWGYDGTLLYAVQNSYGGPDGLRRLVDAAHAEGLAVVLDVVYNHIGPEGNYLGEFGPYFTEKYRTPWGPAVNYDDAESGEVRRYVLDNARHWIAEYHVDGLRLDAIHGIFDFGARHILQEIAESARAVGESMGRRVVVIGESDMNDPKVVRPASEFGWGLDAQWADDLHHAVHSALTGETRGYYEDFGGAGPVARALRTPFVFAGDYSAHRKRVHGAPADGLSLEKFVVCSQNHDQVGNRAAGERLTTLVDPARQRLAAALVLLSPYVPLLFMGEEYGETNPFQYFVSHGDEELVEAVRQGRRKEFEAFGWGDEVPDPQGEDTFERSKLDRAKRGQGPHAGIEALYRDLLALRKSEPALRPGDATVRVEHEDGDGLVWLYLTPVGAGAQLVAAFNLTDQRRGLTLAHARGIRRVLSTHDARYGGEGDDAFSLPPWSAALYRVGTESTSNDDSDMTENSRGRA